MLRKFGRHLLRLVAFIFALLAAAIVGAQYASAILPSPIDQGTFIFVLAVLLAAAIVILLGTRKR